MGGVASCPAMTHQRLALIVVMPLLSGALGYAAVHIAWRKRLNPSDKTAIGLWIASGAALMTPFFDVIANWWGWAPLLLILA